jgi:hypothetical protein
MNINASSQLDIAYQLPRDMYYQLMHDLCGSLPSPLTDTPDDLVRRNHAAIAQVASMLPANAEEASIAGRVVLANAQAMDALRESRKPGLAIKVILQCSAQSASMMRQANAARSLLLRVQAAREKREAISKTNEQAVRVEQCAIGHMADALTQPAPKQELPSERAPKPDQTTSAGRAEKIQPRPTALTRLLGNLPARYGFTPPTPEQRTFDTRAKASTTIAA